ncbi:hypothetical protein R3P38DRAFT_3200902 [Favolaschia claudopus]|uniref:Uncharacterized protein n=1 Tax=Favolaschia claudopus TaxID=2862362 RepID=A0AAW0B207_9AGAR
MRRIINPNRVPPPRRAPIPGKKLPLYDTVGLIAQEYLEPHLEFDLAKRLEEELSVNDPSLPYAGDPLPEELPPPPAPGYANASAQTESRVQRSLPPDFRQKRKARLAAERAARFTKLWAAATAVKDDHATRRVNPHAEIQVRDGATFDPSLLEDRDFALGEVVGTDSRFRFRLIPWAGGRPRPVFSKKRLVLMLGGRTHTGEYQRDVLDPVLRDCTRERDAFRARHPDATPESTVLSGGIGDGFNRHELRDRAPVVGHFADTLAFIAIFSTFAMCNLIGFANGLLKYFCPTAYDTLAEDKKDMLDRNPQAFFPCEASIFSAATLELGGPHFNIRDHKGDLRDLEPAGWNILTALGKYKSFHGGHVIFWQLGLVVQFPPGSSILLPAGLINYSFVKVDPDETRFSLLQWAGGGVRRFLDNGGRLDMDFAAKATPNEHSGREHRREVAHEIAIDAFPHSSTMRPHVRISFPYPGPNPPSATQ